MELRALNPALNIEILGVNQFDKAYANAAITFGRTRPWLQDTVEEAVWNRWQVTYRDVRILDSRNRLFAVFNLTEHDLDLGEYRTALKQLFLQAAQVVDADSDQLPDDWERASFGGTGPLPEKDPDGDRVNNLTEFAFGTHPKDAGDHPSLSLRRSSQTPGEISFTYRRRAGMILDYFVETSPDLSHWTVITPQTGLTQITKNLFDGSGTVEVVCTLGKPLTDQARGFLRVRAVRPAGP